MYIMWCVLYLVCSYRCVVLCVLFPFFFFFFKQKTAYEMRISDWSSDVCSSDLVMPISASSGRPIISREGAGCRDAAHMPSLVRPMDAKVKRDRKSVVVGKECVSTCRSRWSPYH